MGWGNRKREGIVCLLLFVKYIYYALVFFLGIFMNRILCNFVMIVGSRCYLFYLIDEKTCVERG